MVKARHVIDVILTTHGCKYLQCKSQDVRFWRYNALWKPCVVVVVVMTH